MHFPEPWATCTAQHASYKHCFARSCRWDHTIQSASCSSQIAAPRPNIELASIILADRVAGIIQYSHHHALPRNMRHNKTWSVQALFCKNKLFRSCCWDFDINRLQLALSSKILLSTMSCIRICSTACDHARTNLATFVK